MTAWFVGIMTLFLACHFITFFSCPSRAWKVGVPRWKKNFLIIGSSLVCAMLVLSPIFLWGIHGSFQLHFLVPLILVFILVDNIMTVRRLPVMPARADMEA